MVKMIKYEQLIVELKKEQIVRLTSGLTSPEKGRLATKHYRLIW